MKEASQKRPAVLESHLQATCGDRSRQTSGDLGLVGFDGDGKELLRAQSSFWADENVL